MNLKLKKITLSNFMSFGKKETVVDLGVEQNCLVVGNNMDIGAPGESKNGVGKTTVMQGVLFALYGKGIDKLKADEFVNLKNEKKLLVQLELTVNGEDYKIVRGRKPSLLHFFKGDEDLTLDSMANTDKVISDTIGVTYDVFMGVYFLSPHRDSFMSMSGPEQRKFIESVLGLDVLAERAEALKKINKDQVQIDLKLISRDMDSANDVNQRVANNVARLEGLRDKFDTDHKTRLAELEDAVAIENEIDIEAAKEAIAAIPDVRDEEAKIKQFINTHNQNISSLTSTIKELRRARGSMSTAQMKVTGFHAEKQDNINRLEQELAKFDSEEFYLEQQSLIEQIGEVDKELQRIGPDIKMKGSDLDRLENEIDKILAEIEKLGGGECPYCGTEDHGHKLKAKLANMQAEVEDKISVSENLDAELSELKALESDLNAKLDALTENQTTNRPEQALMERRRAAEKLEEEQNRTNPYVAQAQELVDEYESIEVIDENIASIEQEIHQNEQDIAECECVLVSKKAHYEEAKQACEDKFGTCDIGEIKDIEREIAQAKASLEEEQNKTNPYLVEISEAEKQFIDIEELKETQRMLEKKEQHIKYLVKLLTDSKSFVRKNIVDQYIPFLNKRINEYSDRLGLGHLFEVNTDLSVDITYMQKSVSYYMMSQGERMRLNTATTMAFRDLMKMLGKNCNLLMIDEMFDNSLDPSGCHDMIKFVDGFADHIMLVSHREEFDAYMNRKMVVTKQNGFSSIEFTD